MVPMVSLIWSWSVSTKVKAQRDQDCEQECEDGGRTSLASNSLPWMELSQMVETMAQNLPSAWIENGNMNILTAIRERVLTAVLVMLPLT